LKVFSSLAGDNGPVKSNLKKYR